MRVRFVQKKIKTQKKINKNKKFFFFLKKIEDNEIRTNFFIFLILGMEFFSIFFFDVFVHKSTRKRHKLTSQKKKKKLNEIQLSVFKPSINPSKRQNKIYKKTKKKKKSLRNVVLVVVVFLAIVESKVVISFCFLKDLSFSFFF